MAADSPDARWLYSDLTEKEKEDIEVLSLKDINSYIMSKFTGRKKRFLLRFYYKWDKYIYSDNYKNDLFENPSGKNMYLMRIPIFDGYNIFNDPSWKQRIDFIIDQINSMLQEYLGKSFDLNNYNLDYSRLYKIDWLFRVYNW